jgi:hypothetical protein
MQNPCQTLAQFFSIWYIVQHICLETGYRSDFIPEGWHHRVFAIYGLSYINIV